MRTIRLFSMITSSLLVLGLTVSAALAQEQCPELVEQALQAIGDNCTEMSRNTACYGYELVRAEFVETLPDDVFDAPSDRADVASLSVLQTEPLSEDSQTWGVAVMKLQANVPESLPGQAVTFVLVGDVEVENAVSAEDAFSPSAPVEVQVASTSGINIRANPSRRANIIGSAIFEQRLQADGLNADTTWVRVTDERRVGWVARELLQAEPALDTLPVLDGTERSPMQAFYLRTGVGRSDCASAPRDALMVQGPRNVKVNLTINGVDFELGSTMLARLIAEDTMEFMVLDGELRIPATQSGEEDVIIPAGYRSQVCLGNPDDRGLDGQDNDQIATCAWTTPERVDPNTLSQDWCVLQDVPNGVLNYPVDLICAGDVPLSSVPPASNTANLAENSAPQEVACADFRLIYPTQFIPAQATNYQWTTLAGAVRYQVYFWREDGSLGAQLNTDQNNLSVTVGDLGIGSKLQWEVSAYGANDVFLCSTGRSVWSELVVPPSVVQTDGTQSSFTVIAGCYAPDIVKVVWSGGDGVNALDAVIIAAPTNNYATTWYGANGVEVFYVAYYETVDSITITYAGTPYFFDLNC